MDVKKVKELIISGDFSDAAALLRAASQTDDPVEVTQSTEWTQKWKVAKVNMEHFTEGARAIIAKEYLEAIDHFNEITRNKHTLPEHKKEARECVGKAKSLMAGDTTPEVAPEDAVPITEEPVIEGATTGRAVTEESNMTEVEKPLPPTKIGVAGHTVDVPYDQISGVYPWKDREIWISDLNEGGIKHLKESLDEFGMQDAIILVEGDSKRYSEELNGKVYIVCGRNRWHCAQFTERYKETIPCILAQGLTSYEEIARYAIDNNFARKIVDKADIKDNFLAHLGMAAMAEDMGYKIKGSQQGRKPAGSITAEDLIGKEGKYPEAMSQQTFSLAVRLYEKYLDHPKEIFHQLQTEGLVKTQLAHGVRSKDDQGAKTPSFEKTFPISTWGGATVVAWMNECLETHGKEFTNYKLGFTFIHKAPIEVFQSNKWKTDSVVELMDRRVAEGLAASPIPGTHFKVKLVFEDRRE